MKGTLLIAAGVLLVAACPSAAEDIDFSNWHTPAQIDAELAKLAAAHPTVARSIHIGNSVEGRPINGLKISDNVGVDDPNEGDVVFLGVHHAREWISAEMCLYLAEHLVNTLAQGGNSELTRCLEGLEIWIVPVVNPDGYHYTTTGGDYSGSCCDGSDHPRCWRKNRRDNGDGTFGVDLNRNYGYQWGGGSGSEGSDVTASETYHGAYPFSEPETAAVRDFVGGLHHPKALFSYHNFSQLILRPWGYTDDDPPGERTLAFIVNDSIDRIQAVHGQTYGDAIWYNAFGVTQDYFWAADRLASFTPELRPASCSDGGFNPPASQIVPNNEENLAAALALIRDAGCRKVWIKDHPDDTGQEPSAVWTGSGWSHAFWTSPDIWTEPEELVEGSTVTLYIRVHNDTGEVMPGCSIAAYYTDPRLSLEFPGLDSVLIGDSAQDLSPGDTIVSMPWTVPAGTNVLGERHWCVGAIAYHPDDRPLTTQIQRSSNLACRNFQTVRVRLRCCLFTGLLHPDRRPPAENTLAGRPRRLLPPFRQSPTFQRPILHCRRPVARTVRVGIHNSLGVAAEYHVVVDTTGLPKGWCAAPCMGPCGPPANRKARLLGVTGPVLEPGEFRVVPIQVMLPRTTARGTTFDLQVHGALVPLVAGNRRPVGNGYTFRIRVERCGHRKCR